MTNNKDIVIDCLEVKQPVGQFYIATMDYKDLLFISYADRRIIGKGKIDNYLGIQRELVKKRVKEIAQYVSQVDASFPTSVILAISSKYASYEPKEKVMSIKRERKVAKILDGQHRIAGLEYFEGDGFELNVTIFIDMDIQDQAMIFSTINLAQTKVRKSLSYDLYDLTRSRSPQKTCHNIAKLLNKKENGPFFHKINLLGKATEEYKGTLTQATFIDRLIPYLTSNAEKDRDDLKRGKKLKIINDKESKKYIFRNLFINEKDAVIAKIISNYFNAVKSRWEESWTDNIPKLILNRTAGFGALMRFIKNAYLASIGSVGEIVSMEDFLSIFNKIDIDKKDLNSDEYKPGSSGERKLYDDLLKKSKLND